MPFQEPEEDSGPDQRRLDLIALLAILVVCTAICLLAGPGELQAVIGAAGVLFAAWQAPRRIGRPRDRRRR
ncbi:hypothetical protein ACIRBX_03130 [Kitasatospora sp. NPDC096147]|uniref:hypothetical protein n=1 Tax=Kitasatospora sp. NPDC096147 TaxID=3364093 RepID=UPI003827F69D